MSIGKIIWWLCHAGVEGRSKRTTSPCHSERSEESTQNATPIQAIAEGSIILRIETKAKVAHITTVDIALRYLLLNQLREIQEQGYEVVGISSAGEDVPTVEAAGIRHIPVPMTRNFTPLADVVSLWRLFRVIRREQFTIVHTHNPKPGLLGQLAARLAGVPIVVNTLHGFYFHDHMPSHWRRFYVIVEKIAALCSDVILSQNSEDITTAIREGIAPPEKMKFLGNGIDVRRFDRAALAPDATARLRSEFGIPADAPVVGFVGRLVAEKGILEFFRAAKVVLERNPKVRFLVIGPVDPDKPDALTPESAREYGVADSFTFTGRRHDMPELYALMDLFVLPSYREGFPRSPMEASAMGVPSIVTDIRGCPPSSPTFGAAGRLSSITAMACSFRLVTWRLWRTP